MDIYYLMLESKPLPDNDENQEVSGGFINCWVKAANPDSALQAAESYAASEGWKVIRVEEIKIVNSENYRDPDSIECYKILCSGWPFRHRYKFREFMLQYISYCVRDKTYVGVCSEEYP